MKVRERERVKGEMNLCEMMRRKECEKGEIFRKIVLEYSLTEGDICSINETIQQIIQKGRIFGVVTKEYSTLHLNLLHSRSLSSNLSLKFRLQLVFVFVLRLSLHSRTSKRQNEEP